MTKVMTGVALAALLAGSSALAGERLQQLAQNDPQPAQAQDLQAQPTCPEGQTCPPETTGSLPAQPDLSAAPAANPAGSPDQAVAASGEKFINEQDDDAVLASELMGKTVYDSQDQSLGDVNDLIWTKDGAIQGVVVGVGGFLGIGEKNVAVNFDALQISADANGDKKLILETTSDELSAAPAFVSTADKLAELNAQQAPSAGTTGMTPAAPAPPADANQ